MPTRTAKPLSARGTAAALAVLVSLALAPAATAAGDDVRSGNLRIGLAGAFSKQLRGNGVKMTPKAFSITEGSVNPLTGGGEVSLKGKLRFRRGGEKVVFRQLTATLPGAGGRGSLKGKGTRQYGQLARNPTKLFGLRGGKVTRNGFGAKIAGVKVKFLSGAAKRVNGKLGLHSLRGAKAGSLTVSEQPRTVEVTGGTALLTPDANRFEGAGTVASKLDDHCIDFVDGSLGIAPAVEDSSDILHPFFTFPVTGGTVGPEGTDGVVELSGGTLLQNRISGGCTPPHLATLRQTEFHYNLLDRYLSSNLVIPELQPPLGGDRGRGIGSDLDLSNATVSADPEAHTVTIKGIVIRINKGGALNLNSVFPQPTGSFEVAHQFVGGDLNGTASLSLTTR